MTIEVHGFCEAPFLPLRDAFVANFDAGLELGASLAVTHQGRTVVDLWAGHADRARRCAWERDTIVTVFSTSKLALIVSLLILIDRGRVELDAPVADYWPEFAQGGKGAVTVRHAMSHRGGVPGFADPVAWQALSDWTYACDRLAREPHWFGGAPQICYHAVTYGYLLGEIIRRADGRGHAQFFREEIAEKAGIDFQLGLASRAEEGRVAELEVPEVAEALPFHDPIAQRMWDSVSPADETSWDYRSSWSPASNGYAGGRGIARLCAIVATGGEFDGTRFMSEAVLAEAGRTQVEGIDPYLGPIRMGLGLGLDTTIFPAPTPTSSHWGGYGGSWGVMDPAAKVSAGYAMNKIAFADTLAPEPRAVRLWGALAAVIAAL